MTPPAPLILYRLSSLGDVTLCVPILCALRQKYPDLPIVFITHKRFASLFEPIPGLTLLALEMEKPHSYEGVIGLWRLARHIKRAYPKGNFVDMHTVLRSKILSFFLRRHQLPTKGRLRKNRPLKRAFLKRKTQTLPSTLWMYADCLRQSRFPICEYFVDGHFQFQRLTPAPVQMYTDTLLQARKDHIRAYVSPPFIIIGTFARHLSKTYPFALCEQLIEQLLKQGYTVVVADHGHPQAKALKRDRVVFLTDCLLSLTEQIYLFSRAHYAIVADSANMHLAGIAGTPTLSVWGATHPAAGFDVWPNNKALYRSLPCAPCSIYGNKACHRRETPLQCLHDIRPQDILTHIRKYPPGRIHHGGTEQPQMKAQP